MNKLSASGNLPENCEPRTMNNSYLVTFRDEYLLPKEIFYRNPVFKITKSTPLDTEKTLFFPTLSSLSLSLLPVDLRVLRVHSHRVLESNKLEL